MNLTFFVFGRTPGLSHAELMSFYPDLESVSTFGALVQAPVDANKIITTLGGVTKIAEVVGTLSEFTPEAVAPFIASLDLDKKERVFGINTYEKQLRISLSFLQGIKRLLQESGTRTRFITHHDERNQLSTVAVTRQNVAEFHLFTRGKDLLIAKTIASQPVEWWVKRDRGRPYSDSKSGMLPVKVARMIVNIALGADAAGKVAADPFCGMGTVVGEIMARGAKAIGSDIVGHIVTKGKENVLWLARSFPQYSASPAPLFYTGDAVHFSALVAPESIEAIVTEPYMGPSRIGEGALESREKLKNTIKGLEKLYIGCLRDWSSVLVRGGKVVMALPRFVVSTGVFSVKNIIDRCENLGYTKALGPLEYSRPNAKVQREFFVFYKK